MANCLQCGVDVPVHPQADAQLPVLCVACGVPHAPDAKPIYWRALLFGGIVAMAGLAFFPQIIIHVQTFKGPALMACGIAALIGASTAFGAGKVRNGFVVLISAVLTAIVMVMSQYIATQGMIEMYLKEQQITDQAGWFTPSNLWGNMWSFMGENPLYFFYWAIGIATSIIVPLRMRDAIQRGEKHV